MLASAWEAGIPPVGTCVADNNPHLLDAIVAYQAGRNAKITEDARRDSHDDALHEETERNRKLAANVAEIQSAGGNVPKAVGRRRRRRT